VESVQGCGKFPVPTLPLYTDTVILPLLPLLHIFTSYNSDNAIMEESQKLLAERHSSDSESDHETLAQRQRALRTASVSPAPTRTPSSTPSPSRPLNSPSRPQVPKRQSSLAQPRPDGTPRTPNRVRFDETPVIRGQSDEWIELEGDDYLANGNGYAYEGGEAGSRVQRLPLLTGVEAPSVTLAEDFDPEDHLESSRPRSGMKSAFMNMANSIM